jgi:hypothetical protein
VSVCGGKTTHHMSTIQVEGCQKLTSNSGCPYQPTKTLAQHQQVSMRRGEVDAELAVVIEAHLHQSPQPPLFTQVIIADGSVSALAANMREALQRMVRENVAAVGIEEFWMCWRLRGRWIRLHRSQ